MNGDPALEPSRNRVVSALADLLLGTCPDQVPAKVRERYEARYLPGQQLYHASAAPQDHAHVLIDHERPETPLVLRWPE